jgi:hypothetical protein
VCQKRILHEKADFDEKKPGPIRSRLKKVVLDVAFSGNKVRRVPPRKFFWGAICGNIAGLIFRRSTGLAVGGFYPEDGTPADLWFFTRLAIVGNLYQYRSTLATYRVADNLTSKVSTIKENVVQTNRLQRTMAGALVPSWWSAIAPRVLARDISDFRKNYNTELSKSEAEEALGFKVPNHRPILLWSIQLALRGF